MSKLLTHRIALTNIVRRIALAAGEIILDHADDIRPQEKADGSPVTRADRAAEEYITAELLAVLPDVPVVGEEAVAAGNCPDLTNANYVWFVDALDGTRDFIAGGDEYTVNIALVKNGMPVLGVVYAPARGDLYAGCVEEDGTTHAVRYHEDNSQDKDIRTRAHPRGGLTVLTSKNHAVAGALDDYLAGFKIEKLLKRSSSLKFCLIASGKADLYPRFGVTCVWDTAAGHAVLAAAGGMVQTMGGAPLTYSLADPGFINPPFVAMGADIAELS